VIPQEAQMIDFNNAKNEAIEILSKTNTLNILNTEGKKLSGYDTKDEIIEVDTCYMDQHGIGHEIKLHIVLGSHFPLRIPKIYLPNAEFENFKYLPHIDENRFICTFDPETSRTVPSNPGGIVKECLRRAVNIIEDGLAGKNYNDYESEFIAYWENKYDSNDLLKKDFLCLIDGEPQFSNLNLIILEEPIATYSYIIYQNDKSADQFINYLNLRELKFSRHSIHYIGEAKFDFKPPFDLKNKDINQMVLHLSIEQQKKFKHYINSKETPKYVSAIIKADGKSHLIGWFHSNFNLKKNGFRPGQLTNYDVLKTFQSHDRVTRVSHTVYTPMRTRLRTDGIENTSQRGTIFTIAGLGSIGSNLMYFLNSFNPEFRLIDMDKIKIENLNRYFLGFNYLGITKVDALKSYFMAKNPFQEIKVKKESIIDVFRNDLSFINDSDFIFLATGRANIDEFISNALKLGSITKPIFILWVEPYLCAGHCVFLHPGNKSYEDYFDKDGYFKFNIINKEEYTNGNPLLSMREAGCQTTYVPYSQTAVVAFLSAMFPKLLDIINNIAKESCAFTWVGNLTTVIKMGIALSLYIQKDQQETIIAHP
jgi:hypothetical protein